MKKLTCIVLILLLIQTMIHPYKTAKADAVSEPSLTVTSLAIGTYSMLALMSDGTVRSWGRNTGGQLGVGTTGNRGYASIVKTSSSNVLTDVVAISEGSQHGLALTVSGAVYSWGYNGSGEIGRSGSGSVAYYAARIEGFDNKSITQISAGGSHSLALDEDGQVWAWGSNIYGQIGIGTETNKVAAPVLVKASASDDLSGIKAVAAGQLHSLALTTTGAVYSWGMNTNGQLGDGTQATRTYPVLVQAAEGGNLSGVEAISAKSYNSLGLKADGTLWAWGDNYMGQLGTGDYQMSTKANPVLDAELNPFDEVKDMSAGHLHTVAVREDGTLWTWGSNRNNSSSPADGQLGRSLNDDDVPTPGQVTVSEDGSPVTGIMQAVAGNTLTSVLRTDGSVWSVGGNFSNGFGGNRTEVSISKLAQITFSSRARTSWTSDTTPSAAAGDTVQISLQLADNSGNPVHIATDKVEMTTDDGTLTAVSYSGSGIYTAGFRSEQPGSAEITATINGVELLTTHTVNVTSGAPSADTSTLTLSADSVTADGTSPVTITLELKDEWGNDPTASIPNVTIGTTRGTLGTVTEVTYGHYETQITSTETGTASVSVLLGGIPLDLTKTITFLSGEPDPSKSVLTSVHNKLPSTGEHETTITLQLVDTFGNPLTQTGGAVELHSSLGDIGGVTESAYGVYKANLSSMTSGTTTITATLASTQLTQSAEVTFVPFITNIAFESNSYETTTGSSLASKVFAQYWDEETANVTGQSSFSSQHPSIATIDATGVITGVSVGQTTLTAEYQGQTATVPVFITRASSGGNPSTPVAEVIVTPTATPSPTPTPTIAPTATPRPVEATPTPAPAQGEGTANPPKVLTDIAGHWAQTAITQAIERGIVAGFPDGSFHPEAQVSRAEFAVMLARALQLDSSPAGQEPAGNEEWPAWASSAIGQLMGIGIFQGYADGSFDPARSLTRVEIAVIIYRAMNYTQLSQTGSSQATIGSFTDNSTIPQWGKEAYEGMLREQIIVGDSENQLRPLAQANRAEAVTILLRFLQLLE